MTRAPLAAAAALALAALTACSSPAEGYVEDAADAIELRLGRMRTNDPLAIAHAASRSADVLAYGATGDRSATVDVRITREEEPSGWLSGSRATRCYRFDWAAFGVTRRRIDCDDRPALVLPPLPPPPTLPGGIDEAVLAALSDLAAARGVTDEAAVRDAVTPLAGGPPVVVDVATVGADVGVSVHVPGQCLFGRISGGTASVWRVPRVLAQPGELGCGAGHAAQGDGTRPPH